MASHARFLPCLTEVNSFSVLTLLVGSTTGQNYQSKPAQTSSRFNFFDTELLKELVAREGVHNFVISPVSVKVVLGMLLEGSGGNTSIQIQKALRLDGSSAAYKAIFYSFLQSLKVRYPGTVVEFANQIFASPNIKLQQQYQDALRDIYVSGLQKVDFTNHHAASAVINGWVSKNTHGLIRTLVQPQTLDPHTKAIVTNALYFRGKWALPFDRQATTIRCFYTSASCKKSFFMESVGQYGFANLHDINAQALEIFYQGSKFSMIFLLPNNDIQELLRDLSYQPLNMIISNLESTTVVVSIPRFSIEFETDLTSSLSRLGVSDLFTPAANLSGIEGKGEAIFINKIIQKAVIEIDEEGTLGAAATGAVAIPLQGPSLPKFQASRPFLFFIRDIETGHYLFEGLVEHPELADTSGENMPLPNPSQIQNTPINTKSNENPLLSVNGKTVNRAPSGEDVTGPTLPNKQPDSIYYPQ